jgi:hypothetical protein
MMIMQEERDEKLWKIAQKRAGFKRHLTAYVVVNTFLWALWYFTGGPSYGARIPWPAWSMLGWGLGLAFNYFDAYGPADKQSAVEEEYERLKQQQRQPGP